MESMDLDNVRLQFEGFVVIYDGIVAILNFETQATNWPAAGLAEARRGAEPGLVTRASGRMEIRRLGPDPDLVR